MPTNKDISSSRELMLVWLGLMLLLGLTAGSGYLAMGNLNVVVNLGISGAKTVLVAAYFMHLRARGGLLRTVAAAGFVWLLLLIGLSLSDYLTRGTLSPPW
jgi:cytochrome c oxidase subunit 4